MTLKMKNQKLQKVLEWERAKDVSDQIEDEDQLRGKVDIVFHSRILHGKFSPI